MKSIKDSYSEVYHQPTVDDLKAKIQEFLSKPRPIHEMMELCLPLIEKTMEFYGDVESKHYNSDLYGSAQDAFVAVQRLHNDTVPRP